MPRILDTTPAFQRFAGAAVDADEITRQQQWTQRYQAAHPEVFEAFFAADGDRSSLATMLRQLRGVRLRTQAGAANLPDLITAIEPAVVEALGAHGHPEPLHVLLVGSFSANAFVAPLGDDLAVFHCLEWFTDPGAAGALVAHEAAHAWHRRRAGTRAEPDLAWEALREGIAVHPSRPAVPDLSDHDYFWYGLGSFEDWLPWCRENRELLLDDFRRGLDDPDAVEAFFGGGFVRDRWRTGFFVADVIVTELDLPLTELAGLAPEHASRAVRQILERS